MNDTLINIATFLALIGTVLSFGLAIYIYRFNAKKKSEIKIEYVFQENDISQIEILALIKLKELYKTRQSHIKSPIKSSRLRSTIKKSKTPREKPPVNEVSNDRITPKYEYTSDMCYL